MSIQPPRPGDRFSLVPADTIQDRKNPALNALMQKDPDLQAMRRHSSIEPAKPQPNSTENKRKD